MPRWRGTLLYPAALVSLFLGLQALLATCGVTTPQAVERGPKSARSKRSGRRAVRTTPKPR